LRDIERNDEVDRDIGLAHGARDLDGRVRAERMPDQDDVSGVARAIVGENFARDLAPLIPAVDLRIVTLLPKLACERVDPERENAEEPAHHVDARLLRRAG